MTIESDLGKSRLRPSRPAGWRPFDLWRRFTRALGERMPKGLFGRSILIVVLPMLINW
jgi:two-component system osmolarity sensor histidine kinase EnvZ